MNCLNCGAPLELADGRTVLSCDYCLSSRQLNLPGDDEDRVVPLDRPSGIQCPRCSQELVEAAIDGKPTDFCSECRGLLIESAVFAEVIRKRRASYRGPEFLPEQYAPEQFEQLIDCPKCGDQMEVHPHYGPGRAVIDSCDCCHLVWLDNSELTSLERTPGRR